MIDRLVKGRWDGAFAGCEQRLGLEQGRDLVRRAAHLAAAADPRSARALQLASRLLQDQPHDGALRAMLARLHHARGTYPDLVARLAANPEEAASLEACLVAAGGDDRGECGLLLAHVQAATGRVEPALESLELALATSSARGRSRALQLHLLREGAARGPSSDPAASWRRLVHALVSAAQDTQGPEAHAHRREAASVLAHRLAAASEAIPLLMDVVGSDPADVGARSDLADTLRRVGRLDEARAIAEGIVAQFGRRHPPERAASHLLLARIARAGGMDGEALRQLELAVGIDPGLVPGQRLLARICLAQGQLARAERALQALLLLLRRLPEGHDEATPAISETLFDLHRVATLLGDAPRAAETLASAFEAACGGGHEALRLELALSRARRHGEALDLTLKALRAAPTDAALHERALETSRRAERVEAYAACLASLLEEALGAGDGVSGCSLLLRLGHVCDRDLGKPERALTLYRRAEDTSERLVDVWRAMASVAGRLHDRRTRLEALRKLAGCSDVGEGERADLLYELAEHELESSDTVDAGLSSLQRALGEGGPRHELAAHALRKALQVAADREPILRLYEAVARASGDPRMLLEALWGASLLRAPTQLALQEAHVLAERLQEPERAVRLLERAVEVMRQGALDPAEGLWAMHRLAERCEQGGRTGEAILWMIRAAEVTDGDESRALLERAAELAAGSHDDLDLAAQTYERLLEREPGDAAIWGRLLKVLRRIVASGNAAPLEQALARASEELLEPRARNDARMERVHLLLSRPERHGEARDGLQAVLGEDPDHAEAATLLADVLQRAGDNAELAALLARALEAARLRADEASGVALALRLGSVLSDLRPGDAADVYRSTLDWVPGHPRLLTRLVAALDPVADVSERAELLERLLGGDEAPARFELALELFAARRVLGDLAGLERALEVATGIEPHHPALHDPTRWLAESLIARAVESPEEAVGLHLRAAKLLGERLGDAVAARAVLESALALQPESMVILESSERGDLDAERRHVLRQSELLERWGDVASARALLSALVSGTFYDREATQRLLAIDVAAGRWNEVAKGCRRMVDLECGPEVVDLALLHADACDRLGVPLEARRGLERAHAYDAANEPVRDRLRGLYEQLGAHGDLASLLVVDAEHAPDDERRFALLREAGRLRVQMTDAPQAAVSPLAEALQLRPGDAEVQLWLVDALVAAGRADEAAPILEAAIARHPRGRSRELALLQHRMSHVVAARAKGEAGDAQLAWLIAAFESFPRCEPIAMDLAAVATEHGQHELAARAWRAVVTIEGAGPEVRALAYLRQAQLAHAQGEEARAILLARKAGAQGVDVPEARELLRECGVRP